MTDPTYTIGTKRNFGYEDIVDEDNVAVDPDYVRVMITEPDGTKWVYTKPDMINPEVGTWLVPFTLTKVGRHVINLSTDGNITRADVYFCHVRRPQGYSLGEFVAGTGSAIAEGLPATVSTT
jgi:hypothetical protein